MGKSSYEIKRDIRRARDELAANVEELEHKVKASANWRRRYQHSPGTFLAASFGAGLVLALLTNRSRSGGAPAAPGRPQVVRRPKEPSRMDGPLRDIKAALIGLAASEAKKIFARIIPGIAAHLAKAAPGGPFASAAGERPAASQFSDADPIRTRPGREDSFDYR